MFYKYFAFAFFCNVLGPAGGKTYRWFRVALLLLIPPFVMDAFFCRAAKSYSATALLLQMNYFSAMFWPAEASAWDSDLCVAVIVAATACGRDDLPCFICTMAGDIESSSTVRPGCLLCRYQ